MSADFDLLVIGSGPAGQKAAIQAAKLGRAVGIVERRHMVGGVCTNTGTIPSKTLREAVLYLTGVSQREIYGDSYRVKPDVTVRDLAERTDRVIAREIDVIRNQLQRNHIELLTGDGALPRSAHARSHGRRRRAACERRPGHHRESAPRRRGRPTSTSTSGP